jgi:phage terminase large subunit GpA-like protein
MTEDAWLLAGLTRLTDDLLAANFKREDGAEMHVGRLLIDARWGEKNALVKQFCRRHAQAGTRLLAAQGLGIGPAQKTFDEYRPEPGTRMGHGWRVAPPKEGDRWVTVDTNLCKSLTASRLALPLGTPGGIELFSVADLRMHALFADHCVAEAPVETTAKGRTRDVWEWTLPHNDNHWWDCLVGSLVAALMLGCQVPEWGEAKRTGLRKPGERKSLAELAGKAKQ